MTQSRLAEIDCRAFRPLLVWSVTPSEAKQIQNCCQNPWIASSPCGLAMAVGDPTKIGTPFSSASLLAVVDRLVMGLGLGLAPPPNSPAEPPAPPDCEAATLVPESDSAAKAGAAKPNIAVVASARAIFFTAFSIQDAANHRWLVQTHSRARRRRRQAAPDRTLTVPLCGLPRDAAAASYRRPRLQPLSSTLRQGSGT